MLTKRSAASRDENGMEPNIRQLSVLRMRMCLSCERLATIIGLFLYLCLCRSESLSKKISEQGKMGWRSG